jgi:hypothetical protein
MGGINLEFLKYAYNRIKHRFLAISLMTYEIPEEWKGAIICLVFKTGDRTDCNIHRGTGLLDVAYKD